MDSVKSREERIKEKLSNMSKEELEKRLFETLITPDYSYITKELNKNAQKTINELIFDQVKETIGNKEFIEKLIFDYDYKRDSNGNIIGTNIHYYSPKQSFIKLIEPVVKSKEIQEYFADAFKTYLSNNIDTICRNVMYRVFTNGLANSAAIQEAIDSAINSYR